MRLRELNIWNVNTFNILASLFIGLIVFSGTSCLADQTAEKSSLLSYQNQIWPVLQARCQGCHQPASAGGKLIVTSFANFLKGGEHGASVIASKPDKSPLLDYLTGKKTLMPKGGPPLSDKDIALFRRWIQEGAKDDTVFTKDPIDAEHPPTYRAAPLISALAYSPDGSQLAVSGYREILIHHSDGSGLISRLVGRSPKILSLAYSSDGKLLAAVGGAPALFGEAQFWNPISGKLINSVETTYDTLFGGSLSPDAKELAFGCADNSVRVISVPDGKQIIKFDNHSDWVFATTFATDGKHLLSAGRDQAIKLILVEGASFIDDINTHTSPERCLVRNPMKDQVLCGGDDGIPRLYKVFRTAVRTMNQEDHNLLRTFDPQDGAITAEAFSKDGKMVAIGAESGIVNIYTVDGGRVASLYGHRGVIYALAFQPDGKRVATGGFDGLVRLYDLPAGKLAASFVPVPLIAKAAHQVSFSK